MIFLGWGPKCPPFFGALIFFLATTNTDCQRRRPAEEDGDIGWRVAVAVLWVEDRRCYSEEPEHFLNQQLQCFYLFIIMIRSTTYQCWWRRGGRWRKWSRRRPSPGRSRTPSSASSTLPSWPGGSLNNMDSFEQITRNQPRCTRRRASQRQRRRGRQWPTRQWTSLWRSATLAPEHQLHHCSPDKHNHNSPSVKYHRFYINMKD